MKNRCNMKTINIAETVLDKTPKELANLPADVDYRLTKIESFRANGFVTPGDTVTGDLEIIDVAELGLPGVRVQSPFSFSDYIRTSPIVGITDVTENTITFETEGGIYKLERILSV